MQVLSPIDPKLAINDDDLKALIFSSPSILSFWILPTLKSQIRADNLSKFPNLKKLTPENSKKVSSEGVRKLENIVSLEHLNLVGVSLDDQHWIVLVKWKVCLRFIFSGLGCQKKQSTTSRLQDQECLLMRAKL